MITAMSSPKQARVLAVSPMPAEKSAYALARYSRSPDSIRESIEWVRTHDSAKFLESFYFQYGHASIADLGHVVLCFEGVSELAATEIEDEQLWDGQARSSRYQDFSRSGFVTPPGMEDASIYAAAAGKLLAAYEQIHKRMCGHFIGRTAAAGRDEAGGLSAQYRGARFRRRALRAVFRHSDGSRPGDQHPHS